MEAFALLNISTRGFLFLAAMVFNSLLWCVTCVGRIADAQRAVNEIDNIMLVVFICFYLRENIALSLILLNANLIGLFATS